MQKYKSTHKPHHRLRWVLIFVIIIVVLGLVGGWYLHSRQDQRKTAQSTPDKNSTTTLKTKRNVPKATPSDDKTTNQVPVTPAASAKFTSLSQSGNTVTVSALVTGMPANGTCVVTFSKDDNKPVVHEFAAAQKDTDISCNTADISALEFGALGEWLATLRYYVNDNQVIAQQTINIK